MKETKENVSGETWNGPVENPVSGLIYAFLLALFNSSGVDPGRLFLFLFYIHCIILRMQSLGYGAIVLYT